MKTCPNCRAVWGDDYEGQCLDCGRPMGGVQGNATGGDLAFRYASQITQGQRETSSERSMKRGVYDGVALPPTLVEVASGFVLVDEEKLREAEQNA